MVQIIQGVAKPPSTMQMVAAGLGQGIGQGISNYAQMSLQQKMTNLQNQREGTALAQAIGQPHLAGVLSQLGSEGRKQALEYTGMQARNDALLKEAGLAPQQTQGQFGGNMFGQGSQQPQVSQEHIPYQDREAIEDIPAQQMAVQEQGIPPGIPPKMIPQVLAARRAQEGLRIQQENLRVAQKREERQARADIQKQQEPIVKEIRAKADAGKTILNAAQNMEKIRKRGNLGITSTARGIFSKATRADRAAYDTQASQFLSYYKALFPRGFTQQEFKHIEENWMPRSTNTDERNEAIENSFKDMAHILVQKSEILDSLRDADGRLPSNAEQKVDQLVGEKIQQLQKKFTEETPPEGEKKSDAGFDKLPSASK